jgi:Restriction endonuclease
VQQLAKWRRFENVVAEITRDLSPFGAEVLQDQRLIGLITGVPRQIDILVRTPSDAGDVTLVVDCKDHKAPVDVKDMEAFLGLLEDVGANRGAIVSALGFSEAAIKRAVRRGVDPLTYIDVESVDWPSQVAAPVMIEQFSPLASFSFAFPVGMSGPISLSDLQPTANLQDERGEPVGTPASLFAAIWNDGRAFSPQQTIYNNLSLTAERTFIGKHRGPIEVVVTASVRLAKTVFFEHVPLVQLRGLARLDQSSIQTRKVSFERIRFLDVETRWKVLSGQDELSVKPVLKLQTFCVLPDTPTEWQTAG